MKTSELIKLLKDGGWYLDREGKKHSIYRHKEHSDAIAIPRHGSQEVPTGTANRILKEAGVK